MFENFIVMKHLSERKFLPSKKPIELLISQVFSTVFPWHSVKNDYLHVKAFFSYIRL